MKRIGTILAVTVLLCMTWISTANAVPSFFTVTVELVGMAKEGRLVFRLTHVSDTPEFTSKRFKHTSVLQREFLATALTAMAANLPVAVFTDPDDGNVPEIFRLYLTK